MFSRGKILVKLALKKQSKTDDSTLERSFTIQGTEIKERPSTSSEPDRLNEIGQLVIDKDENNKDLIPIENNINNDDKYITETKEHPSTSSEPDRLNEIGEPAIDKDETSKELIPNETNIYDDDKPFIATKVDINNNNYLSDSGEPSDMSIDYDDDLLDPDWKDPEPQSSDTDEYDRNNNEIDHEEVIEIHATESSGSKRKQVVKDHFKREIHKKKRMRGEQYLGVLKNKDSGIKSYCVERAGRLLCPRNCAKKCNKTSKTRQCPNVEDEHRMMIFEKFWKNMDWKQKKLYVINHVEKTAVNERTTDTPNTSRRNFSYRYYLTKGSERIPVCKSMFTTTLGIGEKTIYNWLNDSESGIPNSENKGNRGANSEYKKREESARDYLTNIPKLDSHYCRASSKKKYLEPLFESKSHVFREYTSSMATEGKLPYHKTGFFDLFEQLNLSLWKPKKDQCDKCCENKAWNIDDEEYQHHIKMKDEARQSKISDKERATHDASVKVLCMDLQSLLICPRLEASCLYYKMKLSCHNFTFYDLITNEAKNYFWHEGEGELNANIFATCVIDYLDNIDLSDVKEIIIYSDGCTYQNRNTTIANAILLWAARKNVLVHQKYLERGHTQMECDSVHSCIERKIRKQAIYVPQMYVDKILAACRKTPYKVQYVDHTFFKRYDELGYYPSIRPGTGVGSPTVTDIRVLKYLPEGRIQYKLNHDDTDFVDIPKARSVRSRNVQVSDMELVGNLYNSSLPIKKAKYLHLMQLKSVIPKDFHGFYDSLSHAT